MPPTEITSPSRSRCRPVTRSPLTYVPLCERPSSTTVHVVADALERRVHARDLASPSRARRRCSARRPIVMPLAARPRSTIACVVRRRRGRRGTACRAARRRCALAAPAGWRRGRRAASPARAERNPRGAPGSPPRVGPGLHLGEARSSPETHGRTTPADGTRRVAAARRHLAQEGLMFAVSLAGSGRRRLRRAVCALLIATVTVIGRGVAERTSRPARPPARCPRPSSRPARRSTTPATGRSPTSLQQRLDALWDERAGHYRADGGGCETMVNALELLTHCVAARAGPRRARRATTPRAADRAGARDRAGRS